MSFGKTFILLGRRFNGQLRFCTCTAQKKREERTKQEVLKWNDEVLHIQLFQDQNWSPFYSFHVIYFLFKRKFISFITKSWRILLALIGIPRKKFPWSILVYKTQWAQQAKTGLSCSCRWFLFSRKDAHAGRPSCPCTAQQNPQQ